MRIVDRKIFLSLPEGTLYAKYESPWNFGALSIKGATWTNDWWYTDILNWPNGCDSSNDLFDNIEAYEKEWRFELDSQSRDGLYENNQLFAVYDEKDILQLLEKIQNACLKNQ